jgi:hypothetical protein
MAATIATAPTAAVIRLGRQADLATAQLQGGRGPVLAGPGRLNQLGAQLSVAALGDAARQVELPLEYSLGVSPQKPMNCPAVANRRQSPTSPTSVGAPGG